MTDPSQTPHKSPDSAENEPGNQPPPIEGDLFCPECSYNLRGLIDDRCPECGEAFDRSTLHVSRIPWVHRKELGALRAYWRTVWLVVRPGSRFYREAVRPVSYPDAQRFRWVTILHAFVPLCIATTYGFAYFAVKHEHLLDSRALHVAGWASALVGTFLFLVAVTGVSSCFFHPRYLPVELQNRTVAMSYYGFATWAWTPIAGALVLTALSLDWADAVEIVAIAAIASIAVLLAAVILVAQVLLGWFDLLHIANKAMDATPARLAMMGVALPLTWVAVALAIFGGIPFVIGYVTIIVASMAAG